MAKPRIRTLLALAALELEMASDPFAGAWLERNEVTADECFALGEQMALAIRVFLEVLKAEPAVAAMYITPALFASENAKESSNG